MHTQAAFDAGFAAYADAAAQSDNPHEEGSALHDAWNEGYLAHAAADTVSGDLED